MLNRPLCRLRAGAAITLVLTALPGSTSAQQVDMMGPGTVPCSVFNAMSAKSKTVEDSFFTWMRGFMSGSNSELRLAGQPTRNLNDPSFPPNKQEAVLREFCRASPNERVLFGVGAIFQQLASMKEPRGGK